MAIISQKFGNFDGHLCVYALSFQSFFFYDPSIKKFSGHIGSVVCFV